MCRKECKVYLSSSSCYSSTHRTLEKLAIDITGPFITAPKHHHHIIIMIELLFTDEVTTKMITDWMGYIFARFGNLEEIVTLKTAKGNIEGMNHVLKESELDRQKNIQTYSMPYLPLKKELEGIITDFIIK